MIPSEKAFIIDNPRKTKIMTDKKFPRTFHLPFSPGFTSDDKVMKSTDSFIGKEVVATIKKDGENSTLRRDMFHARSIDSRHHPSRDWLAKFHASIAHDIPEGWRICGENLYARHSIAYNNLKSYFMGFSVWNQENVALNWDDTLEIFELLGIEPVETIYRGVFDEEMLKKLAKTWDVTKEEGFVVRLASEIRYEDYKISVGKWVRPAHVQTDDHWMHKEIIPNVLGNFEDKQFATEK